MTKITNLKRTITSAATVIAGDSTDIANLKDMDDLMSDVGDWFRSEASQNTLDWIYSDKREEPSFTLDGPSREVLAQRAATHTVARTLPVHTLPKLGSALTPSTSTNDRPVDHLPVMGNGELTKIPSGRTKHLIFKLPSSAPALSPPQNPVGGHPAQGSVNPPRKPNDHNIKSDLAVANTETVLSPKLQLSIVDIPVKGHPAQGSENPAETSNDHEIKSDPAVDNTEPVPSPRFQLPIVDIPIKSAQKSHRKRFSWFRSNKSMSSLTVRSPMMDDPQSRSPRWGKAKLPRRLKIVSVGDGASGKTCLLM